MKTDDKQLLKPYYKQFLGVYFIAIVIAIAIAAAVSYYGFHAGSMAVQVVALMAGSFYVTQKFAHDQKRFFTPVELNKLISATTLIASIFQIAIIALLFLLFFFVKGEIQNAPAAIADNVDRNATFATYTKLLHNPTIILIMIIATVVITFLIQTLNFRFLARRMVDKMNFPK